MAEYIVRRSNNLQRVFEMDYLNRNANAVQAMAAVITVVLALAALIGVKLQIDATDRIQRAQSARDIYREYLAMAINKPEFANPDYCSIANSTQQPAYEHFVEYMLYTAEQTISVDDEWTTTFSKTFEDHSQYICTIGDLSVYPEPVAKLLSAFQQKHCKSVQACGA